jgi:benzoyl-CoA reductase subunit D
MARALGVNLEEFSQLALKSDKTTLLNTQCVIFAESEVVSLIHAGTSKEEISRVVHNTLARRISSMVRAIRLEKDIALIGGMAKNVGFIDSLTRDLQVTPLVPEDPEFVSAIGAALFGAT